MIRDTIIITAGCTCVLIGAWQAYAPAAWIVGGAMLFIGGVVWAAYDEQKKRGQRK